VLDPNQSVVVFNLNLSNSTFTQNPMPGVLPKYTLTDPVFPFSEGRAIVNQAGFPSTFSVLVAPSSGKTPTRSKTPASESILSTMDRTLTFPRPLCPAAGHPDP